MKEEVDTKGDKMTTFLYDSEKTNQVCRGCGSKHKDFAYMDKSGYCDECGVCTAHLGFTNEEVKLFKSKK